MVGQGGVRVGGEVIYAYFVVAGRSARVRVSPDECGRLDLFPGNQVRVALPDRPAARALLLAVAHEPPFVWVEMEFPAVRDAARVG